MAYERYVPEFSDKDGNIYGVMDEEGRESIEGLEEDVSQVKDNVYTYKDVYGEIVTVEDAVAETVKQMRIKVAPAQDLHGYDHPWPGGGGKNLLPMTVAGIKALNTSGSWDGNEYTLNNVTFTIQTDEYGNVTGIKANGTANANIEFYIASNTTLASLAGKTLVLNGCTDGANNTYLIQANNWNGEDSSASRDGDSLSFTPTSAFNAVRIMINNSVALSNKMFYPMLRLSSVSDATFAPYSNICPISGWTGANVTRTGKNLIDHVVRGYISGDIVRIDNDSEAGVFYAVSGETYTRSAAVPFDRYIIGRVESKNVVHYTTVIEQVQQSGDTWTATWTGWTVWYGYSYNSQQVIDTFQIELGSSATSYEPSVGYQYDITFPSSAGTVYGGTLTVNQYGTGTLIVDRGRVDLGSLDWEYAEGDARFQASFSGYKKPADDLTPINALCEMYKVVGAQNTYTTDYSIGANSGSDILVVKNTQYSDGADFKTAMSGVYLVYELEVTTSYALSAPEVNLLLGLNNVWADTGDVLSMLYATPLYNDVRYANRIYETVENQAVATFSDGAESVPMKLTAGIEPVQDLHGYDHPWPAGGGKNIIPMTVEWIKQKNTSGTWSGNAYSYNGVTYTINTDSDGNIISIKANGTASEWANLNLALNWEIASGNYIINGITGGSFYTYLMQVVPTGGGASIALAYASDTSFTISSAMNIDVVIIVKQDVTVTDQMFYPMIRLSSVSDATFSPYSNICPISGWTGAEVYTEGENFFNNDSTTDWIMTLPAGTYYFRRYLLTSEYKVNSRLKVFVNGEYIVASDNATLDNGGITISGSMGWGVDAQETIVTTKTYTFKMDYSSISSLQGLARLMLTIGSMPTSWGYKEYTGNVYEISFPSEAGTVYGGELTINQDGTGVLTRTMHILTITGQENISLIDNNSTFMLDMTDGGYPVPKVNTPDSTSNLTNAISNMYTIDTQTNVRYSGAYSFAFSKWSIHNYLYFSKDSFADAEAFKTWLAGLYSNGTPVQVVYELATPVTYTLTAPRVHALLGLNNVWADTGDILSIDYPADTKLYINKQIAINARLLEMIITANHEDGMVATKAYSADDLLIVNNKLYKASTSIANGATITEGTNVTETTVAGEIAALA